MELERLHMLSELEFDDNLSAAVATGIDYVNRKFGHWWEIIYCIELVVPFSALQDIWLLLL